MLIDATLCQILLKEKCDGRKHGQTDGSTEGRMDGGHSIVPLFAPQMAGDKNTYKVNVLFDIFKVT